VLEAMRPTVTAVAGFTQSAALGVQNAQEILRRWITEAARKRASVEELLFAAYEARSAFEKHKPEPILRFLRNRLGTRQPNHAHATALWEVLQIPHEELVGSMMRDERPPAKWLAMRVAFRFGDMRRELDPRDSFAVRTCAKPLAPDQIKKVRGAGIRPDEDGLDPARILARKHGFWQQAIEEIAANGRAINQDRAAIVLKCLELGLDEKECRELLGGDNAWRAFKARAKAEEKKLWEKFEKNYPKPSPNERYLLWKPF
jgi:hypothetical protein